MKTLVWCCSLLAACCAAPLSAAPQQAPAKAGPPPPTDRFSGFVRTGGFYYDNFFQARDGAPREDVFGATVEGGLAFRPEGARPFEVYLEGDYLAYQDYDPSRAITLGARAEGRPHGFDVSVQFLDGRPSREVRDEFDRADVLALHGQYSYRVTDDWELIGLGEYRHETFDLSPAKANDVTNVGGAVRFRGFGSRFSPEVGARFGGRNVEDDNEDLSQRELYVRLRWAPSPKVYTTLRYRRRSRDYSVEDPGASNVGREDTRQQWVATADWRFKAPFACNLYYAYERSRSTRLQGTFKTQFVSLGLTYRF